MAASDVTLAAGCAVIKALPPNRCIDVHLSGNTLRRRILSRYWTVVQHRVPVCAVPSVGFVLFAAGAARHWLTLRTNVAALILLTEYARRGLEADPGGLSSARTRKSVKDLIGEKP